MYMQKCMFIRACTLNDYFHYEVFLLISLNIQVFFPEVYKQAVNTLDTSMTDTSIRWMPPEDGLFLKQTQDLNPYHSSLFQY